MWDSIVEPFLEERIEAAKAKAKRFAPGSELSSLDDLDLVLRVFLSSHYNMPIFHEYFDNRTLDELVFEAEIIKMRDEQFSGAPRGAAILKENPKEAASLFDDWVEEDTSTLVKQMEQEFMKSNKFVGEK